MYLERKFLKYKEQPITHQMVSDVLQEYRRPNDKIKALKDQGVLQSVKKGVYILGDSTETAPPAPALLANHIYGPSYVSVESALSYYNLIPERVQTIASMTTKPSAKFDTSAGFFTYTYLALPYYAFGIRSLAFGKDQNALIATPEKALADKIATTSGLTLRSMSAARNYVLENLRMEIDDLKKFDLPAMRTWLQDAPKKESLEMLIKTIERL